ncbi:MAG: CDP-alcohol phosphatidyltransferase family protein [Gammaproteobacteria bacterium]|nr:CDP-alcohol phosphatidyltransferase family protein [Gammaproteobacteria bacterium]MCP5426058.1 CDP-alcohol phosphatidyltransferase family protein [Gammaproteobacteria bacterium]
MSFVWQVLGVFGLMVGLLLLYLRYHAPIRHFSPANRVTLARAALVALLMGFIGHPQQTFQAGWVLIGLATTTLLLDGLDGWLARFTRTVSDFGARFDMETDALLIAVLAILLWQMQKAGWWVLGSGALRYLFVGAACVWPWLRRPLPYSRRRQTVCVLQTVLLIVGLSPVVSADWATGLAGLGLASLIASFTVDTLWLARHAQLPTAGGPIP